MRRRLLLILAAVLALVLGAGIALLSTRALPSGTLETDVTDVTVVAPPTTEPPETEPPPKPKPKPPEPEPEVDRRCWTMFGGGPRRELARPAIDLGIPKRKPMWARGLKEYIEYPPSYCDGVLYVNTFKGDTWAIEAESGKVLWRKVSRSPKPSTPAISGDNIIVSSKDGTVTALTRRSGKRVWQIRTDAIVESSPAVAEGVVFFGATDGRLFAVDADTGRIRWAFDTGGRINSSPSLAEGRVCITTYAGSIFCLRQRDGHKLWSTYVKRDAFRYESFYASASTDGRRLYTIARSGRIVALDAANGRVIWTEQVNSLGYSTPAVGRDRIFVGDFNGGLRAYRKTDGRLLWRTHVGGRILGAPVVVGELVFFSTLETETYAARTSDGRVVWRYGLGKYSPGIATEQAYYFSLNGLLVAFEGRDGPA
jgi:outer membrane protein assembly factor BamB